MTVNLFQSHRLSFPVVFVAGGAAGGDAQTPDVDDDDDDQKKVPFYSWGTLLRYGPWPCLMKECSILILSQCSDSPLLILNSPIKVLH